MRFPGKRDRKRKHGGTSGSSSALSPIPPAEGAPEAATAAQPAVATSSPAPARTSPRAPYLPVVAAVGLGPIVALLFVSSLASLSSPAPSTASDAFDPLQPLDDPPLPPRPLAPPSLAIHPLPERPAALEGDGWPALATALAAAPRASAAIRSQLERAARDPRAALDEATRAHVRALWPCVQALETAARHEALLAPGGGDVLALRDAALASLVIARMDLASGARPAAAARAVALVALGRALARSGDPLRAIEGAALSRLGRTWLESSLGQDRWTAAELAWLERTLSGATRDWPAGDASLVARVPTRSSEEPEASVARALSAEAAAIDSFTTLVGSLRPREEGAR